MNSFRYGPVELYLVGLPGTVPSPGVIKSLTDLLDTGLVNLLDFVLISRALDGTVEAQELESSGAVTGIEHSALLAAGLIGADDIDELSQSVAPGQSAAIVALEMSFQRDLASNLTKSGGEVLNSSRIPAPVVNALLDVLEQD